MAIPGAVIEEIKYRSDIESVISSYISLKRRGKNLIGLCPFHGEKTPSFTIYPENGSFYCFGCKVGGDVFTFVKMIENLDYIEAVKLLADRAGVTVPENGYDDSLHRLRNTIYEINRETARFYHGYLMSEKGKWAQEYYLSRGLSLKTVKAFGLGAAPDEWDALSKHLRNKGYSFEDMYQANVVSKSQKGSYFDRFRKRIMFPIINIRGNVVGFSGRRFGEDKNEAKYINTGDTPVYKKSQNLFALNIAKANCAKQLLLVEGNLDAISLHQAGFNNAVAPLGTAFTEEQAQLISRYTEEVVICFDSDEAGKIATKKAMNLLSKTGVSIKIMQLPDGKDPDEFLKKNTPEAFGKLLDGAVSDIEFKLLDAADTINPNSDEGKIKYLKNAAEILSKTSDPIEVEYYITKLSSEYGMSKSAIISKIAQLKQQEKKKEHRKEISKVVNDTFDRKEINPERRGHELAEKAERTILSVVMNHPDKLKEVTENITEESFITSLNRRIFSVIKEILNNNQFFDISLLGDRFSPEELGLISRLLNEEKIRENIDAVLRDCFKVLRDEKELNINPESTDEWEDLMKKLQVKKRGTKNE